MQMAREIVPPPDLQLSMRESIFICQIQHPRVREVDIIQKVIAKCRNAHVPITWTPTSAPLGGSWFWQKQIWYLNG